MKAAKTIYKSTMIGASLSLCFISLAFMPMSASYLDGRTPILLVLALATAVLAISTTYLD